MSAKIERPAKIVAEKTIMGGRLFRFNGLLDQYENPLRSHGTSGGSSNLTTRDVYPQQAEKDDAEIKRRIQVQQELKNKKKTTTKKPGEK
jgi:hypothetical protein